MDAKKKSLLAVVLGLVWMGLVMWQWGTFTETVRVPLTNVSGPPSAGHSAKGKSGGLRVNLELLASARTQREETFTTPRNIFAVPRPDGTLPVAGDGSPIRNSTEQPQERMLAQQMAVTELSQYRYLGFLRMGESRKKDIAVLSKNEDVIVVKVGDHVDDHLILKTITPESVIIRDTGARIEQTVLLSEEPPLQP